MKHNYWIETDFRFINPITSKLGILNQIKFNIMPKPNKIPEKTVDNLALFEVRTLAEKGGPYTGTKEYWPKFYD